MTGVQLPDPTMPYKLGEHDYCVSPPCLPEQLADDVEELTPIRPNLSEAEWVALGQAVQDKTFLGKLIAFSNYTLNDGETW